MRLTTSRKRGKLAAFVHRAQTSGFKQREAKECDENLKGHRRKGMKTQILHRLLTNGAFFRGGGVKKRGCAEWGMVGGSTHPGDELAVAGYKKKNPCWNLGKRYHFKKTRTQEVRSYHRRVPCLNLGGRMLANKTSLICDLESAKGVGGGDSVREEEKRDRGVEIEDEDVREEGGDISEGGSDGGMRPERGRAEEWLIGVSKNGRKKEIRAKNRGVGWKSCF